MGVTNRCLATDEQRKGTNAGLLIPIPVYSGLRVFNRLDFVEKGLPKSTIKFVDA